MGTKVQHKFRKKSVGTTVQHIFRKKSMGTKVQHIFRKKSMGTAFVSVAYTVIMSGGSYILLYSLVLGLLLDLGHASQVTYISA